MHFSNVDVRKNQREKIFEIRSLPINHDYRSICCLKCFTMVYRPCSWDCFRCKPSPRSDAHKHSSESNFIFSLKFRMNRVRTWWRCKCAQTRLYGRVCEIMLRVTSNDRDTGRFIKRLPCPVAKWNFDFPKGNVISKLKQTRVNLVWKDWKS